MKYARSICCFVTMMASLSAFALTAVTNGVTWTYSIVSGGARISGGSPTSGVLSIPSQLGGYNVTGIGKEAFRGCASTAVTIPDSVTYIGTNAFRECRSLSTLELGNNVEIIDNAAFRDCSNLASLTLPASLTLVHNSAFYGCTKLTDVVIPDNVIYLRPSAFRSCTSLKRVTLGKKVDNVSGEVFKDCSLLTSITFNGNAPNRFVETSLEGVASDCCVYVTRNSTGWGVTIPGTWKGIAINWAQYMIHLDANGGTCAQSTINVEREMAIGELPVPSRKSGESATFFGWFTAADGGEEVTSETVINSDMTIYAHWGPVWRYNVNKDGTAELAGYSLSEGSFIIPSEIDGRSIVSIATNAFSGCTGITSVTIPNCVTNIGAYAFSGCSGMESFVVGEGHPAFCSVNGMLLSKDGKILVRGVNGDVSIPDGVMKIDDCAFDGRSGLTGVTIPNSVTNIGAYAFSGCSRLRSLRIRNGVTCIGNGAFEGCSGLENVEIPQCVCTNQLVSIFPDSYQTITNVVIAEGVTNIGNYAFYSCTNLTNVTIPEGVTSIGASAFSGCDSLAAVHITDVASWCRISFGDSSANPLCYAHKLYLDGFPVTDLTIPDDVTDIGDWAFFSCRDLTSVTIPESVTSIGFYAFFGCDSLAAVHITDVTSWCGISFDGSSANPLCYAHKLYLNGFPVTDLTIPDDVTNIGDWAFFSCRDLASVAIPNCVTNIGNYAFDSCTNLTNVTIPESVTSIGSYAFDGCSGLTGVAIPNSVTSIGSYAFRNCSGLAGVTIPNSVTNIGPSAFSGCSELISITVASCNVNYSSVNGLLLSKDGTTLVVGVNGNVMIPSCVTSIGSYAFDGCSGLTSVTIPESVTSIGEGAFSWCRGLKNMTILGGVTNIGRSAFCNCSALTSVVIPDSVIRIGEGAFSGCSRLTRMTLPFVGGMRYDRSPRWYRDGRVLLFGYIFGQTSFSGGTLTQQYYQYYSGDRSINYYIPYSLRTVTITDAETIGYGAFYNCNGLTSVTLPERMTDIGDYAFYGCGRGIRSLESVTIPVSVTNIGQYAFSSCSALTNILFQGNAPLVDVNAFSNVNARCCAYVHSYSTGWDVTIPGRWNGIAIDYVHYVVTMDANGGTCETASLDVREGSSVGALPEPTWGNAVFLGWFTEVEGGERVDESLIVTEPTMLHAHWLTEVARPVIVSDLGAVFRADSCKVSITSETEGATIYYTDDGTTPKRYDDYLYAGPVTITDTTTFKAVAVVGGLRSAYTTVTITKHNLTLGEALNVGEGVALATNPVLPWQPIYDSHAKLGDATARSSVIGNRTNTWLSATVSGAGTMTFWYKVSCEHDGENNLFTCDRLMVYTNDVEITDWRMDGETGWAQRELTFAGGENTVKWVYYKDKSDSAGEDCAWVDGITWTPSGADVGLVAWLAERHLAADSVAANGRTAAECYALGLDPALATNDFRIVSIEMVDGKPKVEWEPKTNRWMGTEIPAVLKGAEALEGEWQTVTEENKAGFRFFKVVVEVP